MTTKQDNTRRYTRDLKYQMIRLGMKYNFSIIKIFSKFLKYSRETTRFSLNSKSKYLASWIKQLICVELMKPNVRHDSRSVAFNNLKSYVLCEGVCLCLKASCTCEKTLNENQQIFLIDNFTWRYHQHFEDAKQPWSSLTRYLYTTVFLSLGKAMMRISFHIILKV